MRNIVLASRSPRRRKLLKYIAGDFEIIPAEADEVMSETEPQKVVCELSAAKAEEVFYKKCRRLSDAGGDIGIKTDDGNVIRCKGDSLKDFFVIGSDTIVVHKGEILGKPVDEDDAFRMLKSLEDDVHSVYTGVTIIRYDEGIKKDSFYEETFVYVKPMTDDEIEAYIETGQPMDKAGAYGIQTEFGKFIDKIKGDYDSVVGLPVERLFTELVQMGLIDDDREKMISEDISLYKEMDRIQNYQSPVVELKYWELIGSLQMEIYKAKLEIMKRERREQLLKEGPEPEEGKSIDEVIAEEFEKYDEIVSGNYKIKDELRKYVEETAPAREKGEVSDPAELEDYKGKLSLMNSLQLFREKRGLMDRIDKLQTTFPYDKRYFVENKRIISKERKRLEEILEKMK